MNNKYKFFYDKVLIHGLKIVTLEENFKGSNCNQTEIACSNGHVWKTKISNLLNEDRIKRPSKGCPQCAKLLSSKYSENKVLARIPKGHTILSHYSADTINPKVKVRKFKISCVNGHIYEKATKHSAEGCPQCSETTFVGQERVRIILETQTKQPFIKVRPDWLVNPETGRLLELDGYCEALKIAFEYQGRQHYSNDTQYAGDYVKQLARDEFKAKKCVEHGIKLLIIKQPRFYDSEKFFSAVAKDCAAQNYPLNINAKDIDFSIINDTNTLVNKYNEFKELVEQNNYQLVSPTFTTMEDSLDFLCEEGHIFNMKGSMFKTITGTNKYRNIACKDCNNKTSNYVRSSIDLKTCVDFANNNNLMCLSTEYISVNALMNWKCSHGHLFEKTYRQMQRNLTGQYCPHCITEGLSKPKPSNKVKPTVNAQGALNVTLQTCLDFGLVNKLVCLSTEYKNVNTLMDWKCEHNHLFQKTFRQMQRNLTGQYCPKCVELNPTRPNFGTEEKAEFNLNGSKNITLETCMEFAKENNLVCLSTDYKNVNSPMDWQCAQGHTFQKNYRQFLRSKKKNYCPHC